ncbi:MAG: polyprenyl synthetase family protein [Deltaproteobacteria bacterium]|nr:polyprenyl synthetase family protein [Deltaproteobacteria bacterium]
MKIRPIHPAPSPAPPVAGPSPTSGVVASGSRPAPAPELGDPADWPGPGPLDLSVHDLPHASSTLEWWYLNGHVKTASGRNLSFFVAFFRQAKGRDPETHAIERAHSVTWSIADADQKKYVFVSGVDPSAPAEGLKRLKRGLGSKDPRLNRALSELLARGNVPSPDRLIRGRVFVGERRLDLDYGGATFRKLDDGSYALRLQDDARKVGVDVVFHPLKKPVRHGDDGVVRGSDSERMFYYFIPRCRVTGTITAGGEREDIAEGQGWYDHEFGRRPDGKIDGDLDDGAPGDDPIALEAWREERRERKEQDAIGWNWLSAQLDDGTDLTVYPLVHLRSNQPAGNWAIVIDPQGNRSAHHDFRFDATETWQSTQTFYEYPVRFRCEIPQAGIELDVSAAFDDQEFITLVSKPSFWEGRVHIEGKIRGRAVKGVGFVERSGFAPFDDLDSYFKAVGRVVRKSIREVIPLEPTYAQARDLIGTSTRDHYMDGMDIKQLGRTLIQPIREITDRGGKGWRSYAAITCCDIVGGDSREFVQWLALPEMMHVGSLIVDDVQDKSVVRRGGPAAHLMYGEAQAINSGTAAYFLGNHLISSARLSDRNRVRIYELYFEALRAGHAGQAIDLDGFAEFVPSVVESGAAQELERRVLAVHRLKTAAPAACLARMGAIAGGGSDAQVEALGGFFEALGLAFQIVDDVLNLRGFKGDLKSRGEDVTQGKITLPVAKAMSRLGLAERRSLHAALLARPEDPAEIQRIIEVLEDSGAVEACAVEARELIETGWAGLEPLIEDSLAKMMLRAFGWFVLERHY